MFCRPHLHPSGHLAVASLFTHMILLLRNVLLLLSSWQTPASCSLSGVLLAQEVLAQLYHKASLVLVLVASAFLDFLFRKGVFYKEKVGRDPLERKRRHVRFTHGSFF